MSVFSSDLSGAAILAAVFGAVILAGEAWARLGTPSAEASRKFVHLGGGLACLLFPVVVSSPWIVLAMATAMAGFFHAASAYGFLKSVHGVKRSSRGSEYYPLAIFFVFLLAADKPWIYVSSVLILGVADACAALVGTKWGRYKYSVQNDKKSLEGSLAFFVIATTAIVLPALILSSFSWTKILLSAGIAALLLTGFEAISLEGADNLLVPVAASVILEKQAGYPVEVLANDGRGLILMIGGLFALNQSTALLTGRRQTAFNTAATVASIMFAFAAWTLGGALWAIPLFVLFGGYVAIWSAVQFLKPARQKIAVRTTYRALLFPFVTLVFANFFTEYSFWYGPFLTSCGAVLAFAVITRLRHAGFFSDDGKSRLTTLLIGGLSGVCIVAGPWLRGAAPTYGSLLFVVLMIPVLSGLALYTVEYDDSAPDDSLWPGPYFMFTALAVALTAIAQYLQLIQSWNPSP